MWSVRATRWSFAPSNPSWQGNQWLIEGGLSAGERVVVTSLQTILPGSPVKPVPYVATDTASLGKPADTEIGKVQ